ncbi:unnamed protein product [Mucor circinelloides]
MGRVRTKTVKKASRVVIEKYYPRLTLDFQVNKKILDEVSIIQSKRLRNKIAGFTTHLMKRISRGPVRGISFKLQEEERERRDNYVPEFSALDTSNIEVDPETEVSFFFFIVHTFWKQKVGRSDFFNLFLFPLLLSLVFVNVGSLLGRGEKISLFLGIYSLCDVETLKK